nr:FapA family protein [Clostridium neonatale]
MVNDVYSVNDVDLNTGNINFVGDVEVNNSINDGMKVHAKGRLLVRKNITSATASANGPISIMGSVINSSILAGGYDVERKIYLENLNKYYSDLTGLIDAIELLLEKSPERNIGELINVLMDKRFKNITKLSMSVLTFNISAGIQKSEILDFIRNKLMGLNTFNIKSIDELKYFKELIEEEIEITNDSLEIPIDVTLSYCQNSNIVSTGSIFIIGKGQFTSKIKAFDTIEFTQEKAVARGGVLNARKCIKLKTVGSDAGVFTTLEVEKDGIITADIAYNNTVFCFGNKKKTLEVSGRNVKAFMDKDGEIIIEKFVL